MLLCNYWMCKKAKRLLTCSPYQQYDNQSPKKELLKCVGFEQSDFAGSLVIAKKTMWQTAIYTAANHRSNPGHLNLNCQSDQNML